MPGTVTVADQIRALARHVVGQDLPLRITAWDGSRAGPDDAVLTLTAHRPEAIAHLLWAPGELGLARAYVSGALDFDGSVFDLLGLRDQLAARDQDLSLAFSPRTWVEVARTARSLGVIGRRPPVPAEEARITGLLHSLRRDAQAISHHYDVGNDFYAMLLGPSMTYSCAYWANDDLDLAGAQAAKYELICRKLNLRPGQRLLDVGCGWGSMVMHAARHHGVSAVGVTISAEQAELARDRVKEAGLDDRIEIRLQDYREVADGPFDAISSIGMFEHVGEERIRRYFSHLGDLLRPGGRFLNHAISRPDPADDAGIDKRSFVGRYVFPDGALIEVGKVVTAMQTNGLEVRDVHSLREHYATTLRAWVANLEANWDEAQRMVGPGRARVWRLYLAGSALGFAENRIAIHQVLGVRPHRDGRSDMAPTRVGMDLDAGQSVPAD